MKNVILSARISHHGAIPGGGLGRPAVRVEALAQSSFRLELNARGHFKIEDPIAAA